MSPPFAGLCGSCRHVRRIESRKGSVFFLCERSRHDSRFPRYPRLPVLRCVGYEPVEAGAGGEAGCDGETAGPSGGR